jgi:mono/diheme cytochrome c family protein
LSPQREADGWHVSALASHATDGGVPLRKNSVAPREDDHMTRSARTSPAGLVATLPIVLGLAQQPVWAQSDQRTLGMRLFNQSCRVCHTKPQLTSPQYAPILSMNTLGGNADALRQFISNGSPRMPGFKYTFKPAEIDAIGAYIKTIPAPAESGAPASGKGNASPGAD